MGAKLRRFVLLYVALLQIHQKYISGVFTRNANFPSDRSKIEYEMLMEYEQCKTKISKDSADGTIYSNLYVIETNDTEKVQNSFAKNGLIFIKKVFEDENIYLFKKQKSRRYPRHIFENGYKNSMIQWTVRQSLEHRVHRRVPLYFSRNISSEVLISEIRDLRNSELPKIPSLNFNDPLFKEQWYLHNWGQTGSPPGNDINVLPVWRSGITGRGVVISVLDDGVYETSAEVADNYDSASSEEYLFRSAAFQPISENSHGTRCAAIAAGVANNNVCGVGVAYEAKVGGVRILDGPLTDVQEALALVHALDHVDIYTASWGPEDRGKDVDGPKRLARMAFIKGVTTGRKGKGSLYVWAAGNGGGYHDNCSLDGYASSPFTLTIGALTENGRSTFYTEACAAVIASVYVGGQAHTFPSKKKWKADKERIKVVVPEGRGKCKETFQGTSAAAPMAAGIIALALQANPSLTWRDVQHLIIRSSRVPNTQESGWIVNGAGFAFHPKIGSGVMDSEALVELARRWTPVGSLRVWTKTENGTNRSLPARKITFIPIQISKFAMQQPPRQIDKLETVIITASIFHSRRGDLSMFLQSPSGTSSPILERRGRDNATTGFHHWDFVSLHFWGEDPEGLWLLQVRNHHERITGSIHFLSITLHGTRDDRY